MSHIMPIIFKNRKERRAYLAIIFFPITINLLLPFLVCSSVYTMNDANGGVTNYTHGNGDIGVNENFNKNPNPLFANKHSSQFLLYYAFSSEHINMRNLSQAKFENLHLLAAQYGESTYFFKMNGRRNFELIYFAGFGKCAPYRQLIAGLSQDLILPLDLIPLSFFKHFYAGASLGIYIGQEITDRIGSRFSFGQKYFLGYGFGNFTVELYKRHFSNGDLTEINHGQNFFGLALGYSF